MKLSLLPLIALALAAGACSINTAPLSTGPAIRADNKVTQWGELPSYQPTGHRFSGVSAPHLGQLQVNGEVRLDLLVNPDGTIQDVAIFESSGDTVVDKAAAAAFRKARYSLQLGPDDPSPYVVRLTMGLRSGATHTPSEIPQTSHNHSSFNDNRPMGTGAPYWGDRTN